VAVCARSSRPEEGDIELVEGIARIATENPKQLKTHQGPCVGQHLGLSLSRSWCLVRMLFLLARYGDGL